MKDLLDYSPTELARHIRELKVSPVEVVETYINRIRDVNPHINAVVVRTFDRAMDRAREIKEEITTLDDPPPLMGVPFTVKEMISVEDQPITCGSTYRSKAISSQDAVVVERMRRAGAIPLGLTNIPELGLWIETNNPVYGRTHNPVNLERTAGGSSGGEGAIIRAGGTPFGLGSDMGGSIRIPSAFCGIYGHKSTVDQISFQGHFPHEHSPVGFDSIPELSLATIGPMTRHASDLPFLFDLLRGISPSEVNSRTEPDIDFEEITVHSLPSPKIRLTRSASDAQQRAVKRATDILAVEGATVKPMKDDFFRAATEVYTAFLEAEDFPEASELAGSGESIPVFRELARSFLSRGKHTLPLLVLCMFDKFYSSGEAMQSKRLSKGEKIGRRLRELLEPNGILIMPPFPTAAPTHGKTLLRPFDMMYSAIFNAIDLPVTTVPIATNEEGLPTSVQLITLPGNDQLTLRAAQLIEQAIGVPSPAIDDEEILDQPASPPV
jgi:fatty acid amide hydrolase 2